MTRTCVLNGTAAVAIESAKFGSTVRSRSSRAPPGPTLQKVASKYVFGVAPVPPEQVVGSSAPLSVDTISTRYTLMPQKSSSYGGVPRRVVRKFCTSVWYWVNSVARYPSASMTRFHRRLSGPWSTIFVVVPTYPSLAPITHLLVATGCRWSGPESQKSPALGPHLREHALAFGGQEVHPLKQRIYH